MHAAASDRYSHTAAPPLREASGGHARDGDDNRAGILTAAARLFAERGFANVSVRDIAEAAGVTHPLIYYHWRSKQELLAAVLDLDQSRMREVAAEPHTTARAEVLSLLEEGVSNNRLYMLTLARALLDGMSPTDWPGGFPGVEAALRALAAGGEDVPAETRRLVAMAVGLAFGWVLFGDQLLQVVGLSAGDRAAARRALLAAEAAVLEPAFARAAAPTGAPGAGDEES